MEKTKQIRGEFFITPNYFSTRVEDRVEKSLKEFGITPKQGEYMVEIWTRGAGSLNWSDHGCDQLLELIFPRFLELKENVDNLTPEEGRELDDIIFYRFPDHLPYSLLSSVKEGEEITLVHEGTGTRVILTAKQENSVYQYGKFHMVLRHVLQQTEKNK
jgi:hypothetical protein